MPQPRKKRKPAISVIGTGRLGTSLAVTLARQGYPICSLVARSSQSAQKAARLLDENPQVLAAKKLGSLQPADVFLITTPDDQISKIVGRLSGLHFDKRVTALHTSGALSADVLAPLREQGWSTGSIHPLISVSGGGTSLRGAFWSVEGDSKARAFGRTIIRDLEGKSFSIRAQDKALYHAAAVMSSGNVVALFDVALEMLVRCGLSRRIARDVLLPLLASTINNLQTKDPEQALTGTFSRGDIETVKHHLRALKSHNLPDALDLYRLLGKRSLKLSKKHSRIARIL